MARQPKEVKIAACFVHPDKHAGWVRTGDETAVPTKFQAVLYLDEPPVEAHLVVVVRDGSSADVREVTLVQREQRTALSTSLLRRIPLDHLLRHALGKATLPIKPRADIHAGAFQLPGDPEHQAWVSPIPAGPGRGNQLPADRVARAAEIYRAAVSNGRRSPALDVATALGYSRATAARDIRAARERGLLAETGADNLTPPSNELVANDPIWRRFDDPEKWASMHDVLSGPAGLPVFHPGVPSPPDPVPVTRDTSEPDTWLETIQRGIEAASPENDNSTSEDTGAAED